MGTVLIILALVIVVGGGAVLFMRYRQSQNALGDMPPPDIGDLVDYTSEPEEEEEPKGLMEQLQGLSLPGKILLALVPLVLIGGVVVLGLVFAGGSTPAPPAIDPEITITKADLTSETTINVEADVVLPEGTLVQAALFEDGELFPWFDPDDTSTEASGNEIEITIDQASDAPDPVDGSTYTIVVSTTVNGEVVEDSEQLFVPSMIAFYATPTPVPPTPTPRPSPTSEPEPVVTATPEPPPEPEGVVVTVGNGGNVRAQPDVNANIVDSIVLAENVEVLQKTPDEIWYQIITPRGVNGWAHTLALGVDPGEVASVPVEGAAPPPVSSGDAASTGLTASVFNGGNVRSQPVLGNNVVDQLQAGETVELLAKTLNGTAVAGDSVWYQITTPRGTVGWVHNSLMSVPQEVDSQVPVQG